MKVQRVMSNKSNKVTGVAHVLLMLLMLLLLLLPLVCNDDTEKRHSEGAERPWESHTATQEIATSLTALAMTA